MTDKWQAINSFWNSFGIPAYDENSVPDDATFPYITYEAVTANFEQPVTLVASIWYRQTKWSDISQKADEIARYIGYGFKAIKLDDGYLVLMQGSPFAQRLSDDDDSIKHIYIMINAEFCTEV